MNASEHYRQRCEKWADAYPDEPSRRAAYADAAAKLAELREVFGLHDDRGGGPA